MKGYASKIAKAVAAIAASCLFWYGIYSIVSQMTVKQAMIVFFSFVAATAIAYVGAEVWFACQLLKSDARKRIARRQRKDDAA